MLVVIAPNNDSFSEYASYKKVMSLQDVKFKLVNLIIHIHEL
jgi:hypothetical protein